jgi:hypothetical protein
MYPPSGSPEFFFKLLTNVSLLFAPSLFVARPQARGYLGVPYARRFHDPSHCECEGCEAAGRQLYHDPLFLDCCGLVRRVVADLREEFGFKVRDRDKRSGGGAIYHSFVSLTRKRI